MEQLNTYFSCILSPVDTCSHGSIRLSNGSSSNYPTGYGELSGRVEVCVNGEYFDVCSGSVDVQQVCSRLGYPGTCIPKVGTGCWMCVLIV